MPRARQLIPALILVGLILLVGCAQTQSDNGSPQPTANADRKGPEISSSFTPIMKTAPVASPTGSPLPDLMATRQAIDLDREETRVAWATVLALSPTIPVPTYPPPTTPQPRPTGIFGPELGAHHCDCRFENSWIGNVGGHEYMAYAGEFYFPMESWSKPSVHGVILLFKHDPQPSGS
jgi:hypothetical protein